jgi:NTE family protein
VPILFSTVVLRNYAGTCPFEFPPWAKAAQASADTSSRAAHLARQMSKYADREAKPYIHLYDGGLSDNLGVRPFINRLSMAGNSWQLAKAMGAADTHRMLVIVVNAQSELSDEFQKSDVDLSLFDAISASSSIPLNEYSFESLTLLRLAFEGLRAQLINGRCKEWAETRRSTQGCDDFKVYLVEVDFDKLTDKARQEMKRLPTSFRLSAKQVDDLRASAREIITRSRDFQEFMRDMNGRWSPSVSINSK